MLLFFFFWLFFLVPRLVELARFVFMKPLGKIGFRGRVIYMPVTALLMLDSSCTVEALGMPLAVLSRGTSKSWTQRQET